MDKQIWRWILLLLGIGFSLATLPIAHAESYQYDAAGRLTQVVYDDGSSIAYAYDATGNIVSKTVAGVGTTNQPPLAFDLVYPENQSTEIDTSLTFIWKRSTDPDGDALSYELSVCEDSTFTGCSPVPVAAMLQPATGPAVHKAGLGWGALAALVILFVAWTYRRRWTFDALVPVFAALLFMQMACGGGGKGKDSPREPGEDEVGHSVSDLQPGTTYYWKVTASDGNGGVTDSTTWSFTTKGTP